jgi:phospholipase/carboxylesterase
MVDAHIIEPKLAATSSVIWLHGLGADGYDFAPLAQEFKLPATRFIFPHAPVRPITINNGYEMRGWYDIVSLNRDEFVHDLEGIEASCALVQRLIAQEHEHGIAYDKIVLAGFSQGGAIALFSGLTLAHPLAGILALSTYVPAPEVLLSRCEPITRNILMMHGDQDEVIPLLVAQDALLYLESIKQYPEFKIYPMGHSVCMPQVLDIAKWLQDLLL